MFFVALLFFALAKPAMADRQILEKPGLTQSLRGMKLPDLKVVKVELTEKCRLKVTIANVGAMGVPDSAYSKAAGVIIQVFQGTELKSTVKLGEFDSQGGLKAPGGTATFTWPAMVPLHFGIAPSIKSVRVVVDPVNALKEANEANNELLASLVCKKKAVITIYEVDPPKAEGQCWYRGAQNTYGILWTTADYSYPNMEKITLTCIESWDQEPYVPCNEVITVGSNMPNTGKFFFHLPVTVHTGRYEVRVYGYGGAVSAVFPYCIW